MVQFFRIKFLILFFLHWSLCSLYAQWNASAYYYIVDNISPNLTIDLVNLDFVNERCGLYATTQFLSPRMGIVSS